MTSRLSLIFGVLAVVLIVLSGCTGATPTLDPTATNPPNPTSPLAETLSPTAELPTPTPTETPISLPTIDLDVSIPLIDGIDNLPPNALARLGISRPSIEFALFPDQSGIVLWSDSGVYAYRLPAFEPMWWQNLDSIPTLVKVSDDGRTVTTYGSGCNMDIAMFDSETGQRVERDLRNDNDSSREKPTIRVNQDVVEEEEGKYTSIVKVYVDNEFIGILELPPGIQDHFFGINIEYYISPERNHIIVDSSSENTLYSYPLPSLEMQYSATYNNRRYVLWPSNGSNTLFSIDGKYLSYIDPMMRLTALLVDTGEQVYRSEMTVSEYLWLPDALLLGNELSSFRIIEVDDWSEVYFQEGIDNSALYLAPDGKQAAVGYSDGVMLFDAESLELQYDIPLPYSASDIWWAKNSDLMVSDSNAIINRESGELVFAFAPLEASVELIDGETGYLLTNGRLLIVDLGQGKVVDGVRFSIEPESLNWAVDEDALVIETETGTWLWSEASNELRLIDTLVETHPGITQFSYPSLHAPTGPYPAPDGKIYALADNFGPCGDGPCGGGCIWESSDLQFFRNEAEQPYAEYPFEPGITTMAWSPDGELLALGHPDLISIIDPDTGEILQTLEGHVGLVTGLLFSPDGLRLASTSWDGTIIIWAIGDQ